MEPLLTIAIPTYNRAEYLNLCLQSIYGQFCRKDEIEILVSNNHSTDDTDDIVEKFRQKGLAIACVVNRENIGADRNFAQCFSLAKGKYVLILGDDDILLDGALEEIMTVLRAGEYGVVYLNSYGFHTDYRKEVPPNTTSRTVIYSSRQHFIKRVSYWITFASGNIVNKSLVAGKIDPLEFAGTSLVQLNWVLTAILQAHENIVIERYMVAFKMANTGGYKLSQVFGVNLNRIFDVFVGRGAPRSIFASINRDLVTTFFPNLFLISRGNVGEGFSFERENHFRTLLGVFWKVPLFWLATVPSLCLPLAVAKQWNKLLLKLFAHKDKYVSSGSFSAGADLFAHDLICFVAKMMSHLISLRMLRYGKLFVEKLKWNILRRDFGAIGEGSFIESPCMITNPHNMVIGKNFSALSMLRMETFEEYLGEKFTPRLIIGDNVAFNNDCHIGCINRIEIGNNVLGASRIYISDHYHGSIAPEDLQAIPTLRKLTSKGAVVIKDNVWIGEGVAILPGVTIGENAIIGANSVVNKDIPPNSVAAGCPARVIKSLQAPSSVPNGGSCPTP